MPKYVVEEKECQHCKHSEKLGNGIIPWICNKKLMSIIPEMHVTYESQKGSCWKHKYDKDK